MSMNTPSGNLTQTTPIKSFTELANISPNQSLLGINNISQGDGARITFKNLLASAVGTDSDNLLTLDSNGKLQVKISKTTDYSNITDCILRMPQMVDANITNNEISVSGKIVYPFDNSEPVLTIGETLLGGTITNISYDNEKLFYTVSYDGITKSVSAIPTGYLCIENGTIVELGIDDIIVSESLPTSIQKDVMYWYDVLDNTINKTEDGGTNWTTIRLSLPFAFGENIYQSIGALGDFIWVNAGLGALISNGRNNLEQLQNIEIETSNILTTVVASDGGNKLLYLTSANNLILIDATDKTSVTRNEEENYYYYNNNKANLIRIANVSSVGIDYTKITPRLVFRVGEFGTETTGGTTMSGYEGIPTTACDNLKIKKNDNGTGYLLQWQDPSDTVIDGFILSTWAKTVIVRKLGSYPTNIDDGVVVVENTTKNTYLDTPFEDMVTLNNDSEYFYKAFPVSVNGVVNLDPRNNFGVVIYGYYIDTNDTNPSTRVHYVGHNEHYQRAYMDYSSSIFRYGDWERAFFMPRPVMLNYLGQVDYELDHNDFTKKIDGTPSDITNTGYAGNVMIGFPQVWRKFEVKIDSETGDEYDYYWFANKQIDSSWTCYTHINKDNQLIPEMYMGAYDAANVGNQARCMSGLAPMVSVTMTTQMTYSNANGSYWTMGTLADYLLVRDLLVLMGKSTDTQTVFGNGHYSGGSQASHNYSSGTRNTAGMFFGDNSNGAVKVFGIENFYGNIWKRLVGFISDATGHSLVKLTRGTYDGSTIDEYNENGSGYLSTNIAVPTGTSGGYISRMQVDTRLGGIPTVVSGSQTTFYLDGMLYNNRILTALLAGGASAGGFLVGAFAFAVNVAPSSADWSFGSSLSCKPPL